MEIFYSFIKNTMANKNQMIAPVQKKPGTDFIKLLIGIVVVIAILVALKLLSEALGII